MSTNNLDEEDDFFNHQILLGKTIEKIVESKQKNENYISVYFADSSCLEFILNNTSDIFYMEPLDD